jgi:hypothetical protein
LGYYRKARLDVRPKLESCSKISRGAEAEIATGPEEFTELVIDRGTNVEQILRVLAARGARGIGSSRRRRSAGEQGKGDLRETQTV